MDAYAHLTTGWIIGGVVALTGVRAGITVAERRMAAHRDRLHVAGEVMEALIIALVLVFLVVRPFFAQTFYIPSESMSPTLTKDDRIVVNKLAYRFGAPKRHEVVVFRAPTRATGADSELDET